MGKKTSSRREADTHMHRHTHTHTHAHTDTDRYKHTCTQHLRMAWSVLAMSKLPAISCRLTM